MNGIIVVDKSVLVILVLATCAACIWLVFSYGRRIQASSYLRGSLIEGAKLQHLKILRRELDEKAREGPLDPNNPPPSGYGATRYLWDSGGYLARGEWQRGSGTGFSETPEQEQKRLQGEGEQKRKYEVAQEWEKEEKIRYAKLLELAQDKAGLLAETSVPKIVDISLLGSGSSFLLEFSTVMVIIFTILILGILEVLQGRDIATILAAIAGYVLGKTTSVTKQDPPAGNSVSQDK